MPDLAPEPWLIEGMLMKELGWTFEEVMKTPSYAIQCVLTYSEVRAEADKRLIKRERQKQKHRKRTL